MTFFQKCTVGICQILYYDTLTINFLWFNYHSSLSSSSSIDCCSYLLSELISAVSFWILSHSISSSSRELVFLQGLGFPTSIQRSWRSWTILPISVWCWCAEIWTFYSQFSKMYPEHIPKSFARGLGLSTRDQRSDECSWRSCFSLYFAACISYLSFG